MWIDTCLSQNLWRLCNRQALPMSFLAPYLSRPRLPAMFSGEELRVFSGVISCCTILHGSRDVEEYHSVVKRKK